MRSKRKPAGLDLSGGYVVPVYVTVKPDTSCDVPNFSWITWNHCGFKIESLSRTNWNSAQPKRCIFYRKNAIPQIILQEGILFILCVSLFRGK